MSARPGALVAPPNGTAPAISISEKWDHSVENGFRKASLGFACGLVPCLLFARNMVARSAIVLFGAGVGAGIAYGEARYLFDHDIVFDRRHLVDVQIFPAPKK
jgi:inner membrane organizing system protein 1